MSILIIENWNLAVSTELQNKVKITKKSDILSNIIKFSMLPLNLECVLYLENTYYMTYVKL